MVMESFISYESNIMLVAILCLTLVILFVLLLQIYARWFLAEAQDRQTRATLSVARVLSQVRLGQEHSNNNTSYTYDTTHTSKTTHQGLDLKTIDSLPVFIYGPGSGGLGRESALECAICLSGFEGREVGRSLPRCAHAFHVECIDMWLYSHSTCPVCRGQVVGVDVDESSKNDGVHGGGDGGEVAEETMEVEEFSMSLAEIMLEDVSEDVVNNVFSSFDSSLRMLLSRNRSVNRAYPSSPVGTLDVGTIV